MGAIDLVVLLTPESSPILGFNGANWNSAEVCLTVTTHVAWLLCHVSRAKGCPLCSLGPGTLSYLHRMPVPRGGNGERDRRVWTGNVGRLSINQCDVRAVDVGVSVGGD